MSLQCRHSICYLPHMILGDRLLSDCCLSVCLSCDVGALWPNGWEDQYATWYRGRIRPRPHCVTWGPSSPSPERGTAVTPPTFQPCLLWSSGRPSQQLLIFCSLVFHCNYVAISYCFKILSYIYQNLKGSRYPDHAPFKDSLLSIS